MADELTRRLVHASGTILPLAAALNLLPWPIVRWLFVLGTILALALEAVRLLVGLEWVVYDALTREYEQENLAGYALYFVGATVVALTTPEAVAVPAIAMLTLGDPVSGLLSSEGWSGAKSATPTVAMAIVCFAVALPFQPVVVAVTGALAATLADARKPVLWSYVIDDNLTIAPAGALAMVATLELLAVVG